MADRGQTAALALRQRSAGARVLLVEDNAVNREVALELLQVGRPAGGRGRRTASQALERLARTHAYDLILMDVQMPRMDGLEATRRIRALPGATTADPGDDRQRLRRGPPPASRRA